MGETVISGLSADQIHHYADQLAALLMKPLERTGAAKYYAPYDVLAKCVNRDWQCWAACSEKDKIDCVFITYITKYPTGLGELSFYAVGGENMVQWLKGGWELFTDFAKSNDCTSISGLGRDGWGRVLERVAPGQVDTQALYRVEI